MSDEMNESTRDAASLLIEGAKIVEHLPGEPEPTNTSAPIMAARLVGRAAMTLVIISLTIWLWPFYLFLVAIYGWAPNVPRLRQALRYLRNTWTAKPPRPWPRHLPAL